MTREERLNLLKQIEKDIYVPSIESTFLDDAKSCAIHSVIEELEQEPTTQERQAENDKFDAAFQDGYNNGYAQARFDYEQEPTTKNDLGVDCIDRQATLDAIIKRLGIKNETYLLEAERAIYQQILAMPPVTPKLSSGLEKNSKKLEKNFGELDCISRAQTQTEIEMSASRYTIAKERGGMGQVEWSDQLIKVSDAVDIIRNLPSVTPQEPKTGYWIANAPQYDMLNPQYICSECGNAHTRITPYCEMCGAKMVEPQESEDQE